MINKNISKEWIGAAAKIFATLIMLEQVITSEKGTINSCGRVEVDLVGIRQHEATVAIILISSRIDLTKVLSSVPPVDHRR